VQDKGLLAMLANYGVVLRQALTLDRSALNITFQSQSRGATIVQTMRYPEWIAVPQQAGNSGHALTARFGGLDLYWANPLEFSPPKGIAADVLFVSSSQAWLQTERFITNPTFAEQFEDEIYETLGTKILGAALTGVFPSAYGQDGPVNRPSRMIVVGDADFAGAFMQINRGEERNLNFLIRAADWLSNDEDIVGIRRRQVAAGRLDRITDPVKRNNAMALSRTINTIVIPLAVILIGLFLGWKRKVKTSKEKGHSIDV
jgi:ABC-type uncharacterized transport system involved in gliding motility auxiliary subunit